MARKKQTTSTRDPAWRKAAREALPSKAAAIEHHTAQIGLKANDQDATRFLEENGFDIRGRKLKHRKRRRPDTPQV